MQLEACEQLSMLYAHRCKKLGNVFAAIRASGLILHLSDKRSRIASGKVVVKLQCLLHSKLSFVICVCGVEKKTPDPSPCLHNNINLPQTVSLFS